MRKIAYGALRALLIYGVLAPQLAAANEIAPLPPPETRPFLPPNPSITERGEFWHVDVEDEHRARRDASDGMPTLCARKFRALLNAMDPAFESLEIGFERDAAASTPTHIEGTVYLRVRFADATTWKTLTPSPLVIWFDDKYSTENWRVEPPDGEGYIRLSKTLAELGEKERETVGWALGDTYLEVAIRPDPRGRWRFFELGVLRNNPPDPPAQGMRDCMIAMGDDELTLPASLAEYRDSIQRYKAESEMEQEKEQEKDQDEN
jgi:hypothetical protein